jgi:hypothetical protein
MNLHNEIMNIYCNPAMYVHADQQNAYRIGHRDARHAAAQQRWRLKKKLNQVGKK